ncbi:cholecystokinin receptor-like [Haliotis rubra]|uniref:cholecystokinin receptor-like n=1 Tax=Haliotis rubra TaxID=36100 RepID=UPI001EE4F2A7|nr:cholecystokinin receptor-like [Haliotis rubra]
MADKDKDLLYLYNDIQMNSALPVIVFLSLIMLTGFIGNCTVCFVYLTRFKPSPLICFILITSLFDLFICVIDIPLAIVGMRYMYNSGEFPVLCKAFHMFHDFSSITSMFMLLAIAVERYKKICQPFENRMTVPKARVVIVVSCLLALLLSTPATIIYGAHSFPINGTNDTIINATQCNLADLHVYHIYIIKQVNLVFWISLDIGMFLTLFVMYCLIWRRLYDHADRMRKKTLPESQINVPHGSGEHASISDTRIDEDDNMTTTSSVSSSINRPRTTMNQSPKKNTHDRRGTLTKVTLTMFYVSLASLVAYLPIVCLMFMNVFAPSAMTAFRESATWLYYIVWQSYYIQCALNPLIYGFGNTAFRYEMKLAFKKITQN